MRVLPCLLLLLPIGGPLAQTTFSQRLEQLMDGKRILERSGIGTEPLSVAGLTPGLYHLIVQFGEGETRSFRLMKE